MKTTTIVLAMSLALAAPLAMADNHDTSRTADPAKNQTATQQHRVDSTKQATSMERPDAWVLTKVKAQFATSEIVDASDINVDVQNGVVSLRGQIASEAEKQEAMRLAKSTEGVKSVNTSGLTMGSVASDAASTREGRTMNKDRDNN